MCRSNYLKSEDLKEGAIIEYNGKKLELLEPDGDQQTFIDEPNDDDSSSEIKFDIDAEVFIKQRWKVKVIPETKFDKEFITHRYINSYYCTYSELLKEQEKIYTAWEVLPNDTKDNSSLSNEYNGLF